MISEEALALYIVQLVPITTEIFSAYFLKLLWNLMFGDVQVFVCPQKPARVRAAASDILVEWEESFWLWLIYGPSASVCSFSSYSEHLSAASHDRFINEQFLQEPDCFNMQGETMLKQSDSQKIFSESNTSLQCIMWQWRIPMLSDDWVDL